VKLPEPEFKVFTLPVDTFAVVMFPVVMFAVLALLVVAFVVDAYRFAKYPFVPLNVTALDVVAYVVVAYEFTKYPALANNVENHPDTMLSTLAARLPVTVKLLAVVDPIVDDPDTTKFCTFDVDALVVLAYRFAKYPLVAFSVPTFEVEAYVFVA
jgi:hypothetical protein